MFQNRARHPLEKMILNWLIYWLNIGRMVSKIRYSLFWWFTKTINQVEDSQQGVMEQHERTGETHHLTDLFPTVRAVAMDRAVGTGGFGWSIRAVIKTLKGILLQVITIRTEVAIHSTMGGLTIQADQFHDRVNFTFQAVII